MDLNPKNSNKELEGLYKTEIPFGDSCFQIAHFIGKDFSIERSKRKILLQLDAKVMALSNYKFSQARREIDIREKKEKIENSQNQYEKDRLMIDLEELEFYKEREDKLVRDCCLEVSTYLSLLQKMPKFNRKQFEESEKKYWEQRLVNDSHLELMQSGTVSKGTLEALQKIGLMIKRENGEIKIEQIEKPKRIITAP